MYFYKSEEKLATIFVRDLGYIGVDRIFPHVCSRHKQASIGVSIVLHRLSIAEAEKVWMLRLQPHPTFHSCLLLASSLLPSFNDQKTRRS
jgi:hypothetical protein